MHCIFWKFLVVSTENKFLFEDSFNVLFVRIIFLWFFMIFIMAYLWKGFSCGFYDFLHAIFVVMVFVVFCFNPLWFLWFLWFLWSLTFYSCILVGNVLYTAIHVNYAHHWNIKYCQASLACLAEWNEWWADCWHLPLWLELEQQNTETQTQHNTMHWGTSSDKWWTGHVSSITLNW